MKKVLNVLYQSNDAYAMVSGTSIVSLLENNKHLDKINIFYCDYKISDANHQRLEELVASYGNSTLKFIPSVNYHTEMEELGVPSWHGVRITWIKLLALGELSLETDRILFLDGHTIVNGALDELIETDLGDNIMASVRNCLINGHKEAIGLQPTDNYFDCGFMLINHKIWKQEKISDRIRSHLAQRNNYQIVDQDMCNFLFRGRIKTLSITYSYLSAYYAYDVKSLIKINNLKPEYYYTYEEVMGSYYSPKIVHNSFGIKGKPWEEGNDNPVRFLWGKYIAMTPWKNLEKPRAKRNLTWVLYDVLPSPIFMLLYKMGVKRKFTK